MQVNLELLTIYLGGSGRAALGQALTAAIGFGNYESSSYKMTVGDADRASDELDKLAEHEEPENIRTARYALDALRVMAGICPVMDW
jgi:hypothetical protein